MRITELVESVKPGQIVYHGGPKTISQFQIPPYGVFFSPHKEWARHYGPVITSAQINTTRIYPVDYTHKIDDAIIDALFDRDYQQLAKFVRQLKLKGYSALQTVTDSEMVCVFPGTPIQILQSKLTT